MYLIRLHWANALVTGINMMSGIDSSFKNVHRFSYCSYLIILKIMYQIILLSYLTFFHSFSLNFNISIPYISSVNDYCLDVCVCVYMYKIFFYWTYLGRFTHPKFSEDLLSLSISNTCKKTNHILCHQVNIYI